MADIDAMSGAEFQAWRAHFILKDREERKAMAEAERKAKRKGRMR